MGTPRVGRTSAIQSRRTPSAGGTPATTTSRSRSQAALKLFADKRAEGIEAVSRDELVTALGENQSAFRYLQTSELILPRDFWDPTHFVLDPSAAWIAGQR